ncbi:LPP20 family lipoprotein [Crenobacter caeni]|uniref:Lipoprotein LPP20-like domain-containing protein n=1 Tax=Crenobacter caeni TaxID=2705474 RepID=A0A6B2KPS3_9NEIS|nr:LPP20 family lipoprotein [Crenobacter caeni]NDV11867.1 hypothetical protein [Crenobacter caeni]
MKVCKSILAGVLAGVSGLAAAGGLPAARTGGWMVVAEAPAGVTSQPATGRGGTLLGGGYAGVGEPPRVVVQEKVVVKTEAAPVAAFDAYRVRVTGRGAPPFASSLSAPQRRLLAIRASQLDAYRAIAEEVQGFRLTGSSAVSNLIAVNDIFRVYVDAYLRGVRIVSTQVKVDGSAETVAELVLDESFYKAYQNALRQQGALAAPPVQRAAEAMPAPAQPQKLSACTGNGCAWGSDFYLSK